MMNVRHRLQQLLHFFGRFSIALDGLSDIYTTTLNLPLVSLSCVYSTCILLLHRCLFGSSI